MQAIKFSGCARAEPLPQVACYIVMKIVKLVVLIAACLAGSKAFGQDEKVWDAKLPLTWSDYQGVALGRTYDGASMDYKVDVQYKVTMVNDELVFDFTIRPLFIRSNSWVLKEKQQPTLLRFEQLRFDMVEWHARKLRKQVAEARFTRENFKETLQGLFNQTMADIRAMHDAYATESFFGTRPEVQKAWEEKVNQGLKSLSAYTLVP